VAEAAVVAKQDPILGEKVVAVVVLRHRQPTASSGGGGDGSSGGSVGAAEDVSLSPGCSVFAATQVGVPLFPPSPVRPFPSDLIVCAPFDAAVEGVSGPPIGPLQATAGGVSSRPALPARLVDTHPSRSVPALMRCDPIRSDPQVYVVDELPRNHLGKVNKKDLAREMQF
jgi:acyl-CoA synthetase (AMP-forming)/AMP-acid ligase II